MNVFFYPAFRSHKAEECYQRIQAQVPQTSIISLPGGCRLNSSSCLELRSGDIMVLFATTCEEVEELLSLHEEFEDFRIVIVTDEKCREKYQDKYFLLKPRYVTTFQELDGLITVLDNMTRQYNGAVRDQDHVSGEGC